MELSRHRRPADGAEPRRARAGRRRPRAPGKPGPAVDGRLQRGREGRDGDQDPARQRHGPAGLRVLLVVGVGDPPDGPGGLAELLLAHRYTEGLEFVPQGTPTNTTDTAAPAVTTDAPELDPLFESETAEVNPPAGAAAAGRAGRARHRRPRGRPHLALALGLDGADRVRRRPGAPPARTGPGRAASGHEPGAVAKATWGPLSSAPCWRPRRDADRPGRGLEWLREWFRDWVRGGALPLVSGRRSNPTGCCR